MISSWLNYDQKFNIKYNTSKQLTKYSQTSVSTKWHHQMFTYDTHVNIPHAKYP